MVKFYKPGKVVVVLNGRNAGAKGVIVKSNYESVKDRKYPHCPSSVYQKDPVNQLKEILPNYKPKLKS